MKIAKIGIALLITGLMAGCSGSSEQTTSSENAGAASNEEKTAESKDYDPKRGEGPFTAENVKLEGINAAMASEGEKIAGTKCLSCHKLTDERLVGPGWKGVTSRREPHWIMNFITNPDPMIEKDPEVQAQLEICLVRMPNQHLTEEDSRKVLEFMRKNDSK